MSSVWSVTATVKGVATSAIFSEGLLVGTERAEMAINRSVTFWR